MHVLRCNMLKAGSTLLLAGVVGAGCESTNSPTGPLDPNLAVGDLVVDESTTRPGVSIVCVFQPYPADYGYSTFRATATGGDLIEGDFDVYWPCLEIWNATTDEPVELEVSLLSNPGNLELERIVTVAGDAPDVVFYENGETSATLDLDGQRGGNFWFKFKFADAPPPSGGEGCTPGYWRQPHHFDSWTGYAPTDLFSSVFANAFPGQTLHDVVQAKGGGLNALGRMTVAALLNATSPGVSFDYTAQEVIDLFNAAYASGNKNVIENQKNVFDFLNNQGCGLN